MHRGIEDILMISLISSMGLCLEAGQKRFKRNKRKEKEKLRIRRKGLKKRGKIMVGKPKVCIDLYQFIIISLTFRKTIYK